MWAAKLVELDHKRVKFQHLHAGGDYKPRRSQSASGGLGRGAQSALLRYNYRSEQERFVYPLKRTRLCSLKSQKHTPLIRIAKLVGEDIREVKLEQAPG